MNEVDRYVREVLRNIPAMVRDRERIEVDLRAHFREGMEAGESPGTIIARMGSPEEVAAEFIVRVPLHYASFWRRVGAFLIDLFIVAIMVGGITVPAVAISNLVPRAPQGFDYVVGGVIIIYAALSALAAIGVFLLYFPISEGRFGYTLGKRLLGLLVLKESGLPVGYREAFLRRLSFYFDFVAVDALFVPFTAKRQRAFDMVARTVVVRVES